MILNLGKSLGFIDSLSGIIFLVLGLLLVFYGRKIVKMVTFIVGGIVGAYIFYQLIVPRLEIGEPYIYIIPLIGFIISGILTILLMYFLGGLIGGYFTYSFLRPYFQDWTIPLIISIIVFVIVFILFNKVLSIGTAILGAMLVSHSINIFIPQNPILSIIIIIFLSAVGAYYQLKQ